MRSLEFVFHIGSAIGRIASLGATLVLFALGASYAQTPVTRAGNDSLARVARALAAREDSLTARRDYVQREVEIRRMLPPFGETTPAQQAHADSLLQANELAYRLRLAAIDAGYRGAFRIPTAAYLISSALSGYAVGLWDHDAGGYEDSWHTPDKQTHVATCAALYGALRAAGLPRWLAAGTPLLGGLALEAGQSLHGGHFSGRDLAANGVGCGLAIAVDWSIERVRR